MHKWIWRGYDEANVEWEECRHCFKWHRCGAPVLEAVGPTKTWRGKNHQGVTMYDEHAPASNTYRVSEIE